MVLNHQGSISKHLVPLTHVLINWKNESARWKTP